MQLAADLDTSLVAVQEHQAGGLADILISGNDQPAMPAHPSIGSAANVLHWCNKDPQMPTAGDDLPQLFGKIKVPRLLKAEAKPLQC